jgi:hypothetical protein
MGMERSITFPTGSSPSWPAVRDLLASCGIQAKVRMIDGELAFPDEEPSENWRELRLDTHDGLVVTAKRESDRVVLVVWGNADGRLVQFWNTLTWAFAEAGNGQIHSGEGSHSAAEYGRRIGLSSSGGTI